MDPYSSDKPPSYAPSDPYAQYAYNPATMNQPIMLQPMGQPMGQTMGQPMGQPMQPMGQPMMVQTMGQPMMMQPYPGQYNTQTSPMYATMQPYAQPYGQQGYMAQPQQITVNVQQPQYQVAAPVAAVVVVQKPEYKGFKQAMRTYNEGLFCCCDDCGSCCHGMLCPCFTYANVARELAGGDKQVGDAACVKCVCVSIFGLYFCFALEQRSRVKDLIFGESRQCDIEDCCAVMCCPLCALCQEDRIMHEVATERRERAQQAQQAPTVQIMR